MVDFTCLFSQFYFVNGKRLQIIAIKTIIAICPKRTKTYKTDHSIKRLFKLILVNIIFMAMGIKCALIMGNYT